MINLYFTASNIKMPQRQQNIWMISYALAYFADSLIYIWFLQDVRKFLGENCMMKTFKRLNIWCSSCIHRDNEHVSNMYQDGGELQIIAGKKRQLKSCHSNMPTLMETTQI